MTELTLKVNHAAKSVQTTGRVAVGEDVAINLVMDEEVEDLAQLRVRLRFMGRDVAVFPFPGSGDEWTEGEAGEDEYTYTGVLNLNTVQLNALFADLADGAILIFTAVVDQVSNDDGTDDYNVLYGKGLLRVWNWGGDLSVTPDVDEAPAPVSLRECLEGKIDKVVTATGGNIAVFTTNGGVADSGVAISDGLLSSSSTAVPTSRAVKAVTDALDAAIQTKANASALANLVTTTQLATKADASVVEDLADGLSNVTARLAYKVDKEDGKGLSKNNFTDELKAKLEGVAAGATNVTVDTEITEDSGNAVSSGAVFDMKEHLHQKIDAVYTKTEVDNIVAAVKTGSRQVVESLDSVTDPQPLVIYMVAKASAQTSNIYDEYIWLVSEGVGSWEKIGDTEVDLSGYVQKETGKALSSNDYTDAEKAKLSGIESGAQKNVAPVAPSTDASAAGKPADAKATGDALADKQATIDDLATIRAGAAAGATAYQKPPTGIPAADLAAAVQTSLGKADTALQGVTQNGSAITPSSGVADIDAPLGEAIAEPYSDQATYSAGQMCIYQGRVYYAADDITSPELWNPAHWAEIDIGTVIARLADELQLKALAADLRYAQGATITASAQLADRTGNRVEPIGTNTENIVLTFPSAVTGYLRDFLVLVTNTTGNTGSITFTPPTGAVVYGDGFTHSPASGETWLYSVTEEAANVFWCKSEKMEVAS